MVRRSTPQSVLDEEAFPVRVRVLVPECGFGRTLDAMHRWLDREVGRGEHAVHSAAAFPSLVLADGTTGTSYASPALPYGRGT